MEATEVLALVEKFKIHIEWMESRQVWRVQADALSDHPMGVNADLSRAIIECVARGLDSTAPAPTH